MSRNVLRSVSEYYRRLHVNNNWQRIPELSVTTSDDPPPGNSNTLANDDVSFVSENHPANNPMPLISVRVPRINVIRSALSPERVYRPHSNPVAANNDANPNPTNTAEPAPENTPSTDFASSNRHPIEMPTTRPQASTRYPCMVRRLSTSSFMPHSYLRPAYAPHETLWNRQQLNQEIHRRHMMNGMSGGISNDSMPPNTFTSYPNRAANIATTSTNNTAPCQTCHNQHPVRRLRSYLRPWSTVSCRIYHYFVGFSLFLPVLTD